MKLLNPCTSRRIRDLQHTVRFSSDDTSRYKSLDSSDSSMVGLSGTTSYPARDSGAPSPDLGPVQSAAVRYSINEQRIKLLTAINQIVQNRAELEVSKLTLTNLYDELKRKLKRRMEEFHLDKKDRLKNMKQANIRLERERIAVIGEIEHLKRHLEKEESHHIQHARAVAAQAIQGHVTGKIPTNQFLPCSIANLPSMVSRSVAKSGPSKHADNKLAAARLMRDIAELRQRVAQAESRLAYELKRKRQVESDIMRLRRALSDCKSDVAALRLPLAPLRNPCSKFQ